MRERTDGQGFATRAIHAGERPDPTTHAHNTPIYATATFAFDTAAEKEAAVDAALEWDPTSYFYSRTGNPTNRALEEKIASLEGAEDAVVAASGMASVAATLFAHLDQGDHIVVGDELFAITVVLWQEDLPRRGIDVTAVDMTDLAAIEAAITPRTKLLFVETSTNPRLRVADLDAIADAGAPARAARHRRQHVPRPGAAATRWSTARTSCSTRRRSTSPVTATRCRASCPGRKHLLDPIRKQTDTLRPGRQPVLLVPRAPRRPDAAAPLRARPPRTPRGWRPSSRPTSVSSGCATRVLRRTRTTRSRPGCSASRYGAMVTFKPRGGLEGMAAFTDHLRLCDIGVSLGDVFTLVYPRPKDGGIIRVSVGCEDVDDLLEDFGLGLSFVG